MIVMLRRPAFGDDTTDRTSDIPTTADVGMVDLGQPQAPLPAATPAQQAADPALPAAPKAFTRPTWVWGAGAAVAGLGILVALTTGKGARA